LIARNQALVVVIDERLIETICRDNCLQRFVRGACLQKCVKEDGLDLKIKQKV